MKSTDPPWYHPLCRMIDGGEVYFNYQTSNVYAAWCNLVWDAAPVSLCLSGDLRLSALCHSESTWAPARMR